MPTPTLDPARASSGNYLTLNGMLCSTYAWWIKDMENILQGPALKGGDLDLPASTGALGFPRRIAATVYQFEMVFRGDVDSSGASQSWKQGLIANVEQFKAGIGIASASGDGTVTATWTRFDSSTKSAAVHVVRFETAPLLKRLVSAVLELSAPAGVFA